MSKSKKHLRGQIKPGSQAEIAVSVPLYIKLTIYVKNSHDHHEVKKELTRVFSNEMLADGTKGFFYPDNFIAGQGLYLSAVLATAMRVEGVDSMQVNSFKRIGKKGNQELREGKIDTGPDEVIRLENNPAKPENGLIEFDLRTKPV